jgi:hypothetical protein
MLTLKAISTVELRVDIAIPPENPVIKGFLTCDAVVRSKAQMQELTERIENGDFASDSQVLIDGDLYRNIRGLVNTEGKELSGADAVKECTEGPFGMYLTQALVKKYFTHFGEAQAKNSPRSRGR